jgi:hypothetical protein
MSTFLTIAGSRRFFINTNPYGRIAKRVAIKNVIKYMMPEANIFLKHRKYLANTVSQSSCSYHKFVKEKKVQ